MTGWRSGVVAVVIAVVGLTGCTLDGGTAAPGPPPTASASPTSASSSPMPEPQDGVVPAVMLSSVIRTPDGPIRTGIKHPATFIQTQTGFVVQDTRGTTYAVEGGEVRRIGAADPGPGLALVADPGGRYVAWVVAAGRVTVYDVVDHRTTRLSTGSVAAAASGLALDEHALFVVSGRGGETLRLPLDGSPGARVPPTRRIRLLAAVRLSPTGAYVTSESDKRRLSVRRFEAGKDVTPAIPDGPVRQLVWLGPDSFTVEVETASLISPPDGDVWHLLRCSIDTGTCANALTGVTGSALSIPGTPIRSTVR